MNVIRFVDKISYILIFFVQLFPSALQLISQQFINKFSTVWALQSSFQTSSSKHRSQNWQKFKQLRHPVRGNSFLRSTHLVDTSSIYLSPDAPSAASTFHHQHVELSLLIATLLLHLWATFRQPFLTFFAVKFPRTREIPTIGLVDALFQENYAQQVTNLYD